MDPHSQRNAFFCHLSAALSVDPLLNSEPASSVTAEDTAPEAATSLRKQDDVIATEVASSPQRVLHDCTNDASGLVLATLKEEARWSSAVVRVASQITMVTQMSPGRCV